MGRRPQIIFFIVLMAVAIHHCVCFGTTLGAGTASRRRCRPPKDIRALPDYAREAIRDIWKDYVPGARCEKEQLMTEDVLLVLETLDREFPMRANPTTAAGRGKRLPVTVAEQRSQYLVQSSPLPLSSDRHPIQSKVYAAEINGQDTEQETPIVEGGGGDDSVARDEVSHRTVSSAPATQNRLPGRSFTTTTKDGWNAAVIDDNDYAALEPEGTSATRQESLTPFPSHTPMGNGPIRHSTPSPSPSDYDASEGPEPTTPLRGNRKKQPALVGGVKVGAGKRLEKEPFDYASLPDGAVTAPKQFEHSEQLPFLKEADPELVQLFDKVLNDPDTPSERRRQEEIHLLAVSYLNSKQLAAFNAWSTERRKRLQEPQLKRHPKQQ